MLPTANDDKRILDAFCDNLVLCCRVRVVIAVLITFEIAFLIFTLSLSVDRRRQENLSTTTAAPLAFVYENETVEEFLVNYSSYCERNLSPKFVNTVHRSRETPRCPCVPDDLDVPSIVSVVVCDRHAVGRINVSSIEMLLVGELELSHPELEVGGSWEPPECIALQRVAIIVPFRDREDHLRALLGLLHPMLQRQRLHYTVFVAEQEAPAVFNKASLMNAAFLIARGYANFDCYIFHDVDMLPEDDRNFYTCSSVPRHVGSHINKYDYRVPYDSLFGGVTAFRPDQFELVNGFSNHFYGWGGEDDDMHNRIVAKQLTVTRFSGTVARYTMIKHVKDIGNPVSPVGNRAFKFRPRIYRVDGLNSLRYKLVAHELRPLYTWLHFSLPPHPAYFKGSYRAPDSRASSASCLSAHSLVCVIAAMLAFLSL